MEKIEKKKRLRSPNYPVIPVGKAIELAGALFKSQTRYQVSVDVAAQDWGISPKSSYLSQHVAAMSSYGLIDTEGEKESRKVKVSELAFKIIIDKRPDSEERKSLIREAALTPSIFRNIYEKYPSGLPSDHALNYELITDYKFNPSYVNDFIKVTKQTFDFANVYKSGIMEEKNNTTEVPDMLNTDKSLVTKPQRGMGSPSPSPSPAPSLILDSREREIANYPIGRNLNARIIISGASPVTTDSIKKLMALLDLNKEDLHEIIPNGKAESNEN